MANKCLSLYQELKNTQETIYTYKSRIWEYKRRLGSNNKDYNISEADWDTVENAVMKGVLKGRIKELLNEKAEMI